MRSDRDLLVLQMFSCWSGKTRNHQLGLDCSVSSLVSVSRRMNIISVPSKTDWLFVPLLSMELLSERASREDKKDPVSHLRV